MNRDLTFKEIQNSLDDLSATKNIKSRYWASILYKDSAPANHEDILREAGLTCVISPWHDKDINEGTGEVKKAHKHILYVFDGPTTQNNVRKYSDLLNGTIPIIQATLKGPLKYWTHANNPEKAQYDVKGMVYINCTPEDLVELTEEEIRKIWIDIRKLVYENKMYEFCDLMTHYMLNGYAQEFRYIRSNAAAINAFISSYRNKIRQKMKKDSN